MTAFRESKPIILSDKIFRCYHYAQVQRANTGIVVEDGCLEFMFIKETGAKLKLVNKQPVKLPLAFAFGKVPIPYKILFPETLTVFTIKIQPWVTSFFFNHEDVAIVDLSTKFSAKIEALHHRIFQANDFGEMVRWAEAFFANTQMPVLEEYRISKKICDDIYQNQGMVKVKELLKQFPHSRQKLNKLFLHQTKNSIKEYAMYTRIRAIVAYKIQHPKESLTSVTYRFGYFDQAHFIKDMKKTTGFSPSVFFAKENFLRMQLKSAT